MEKEQITSRQKKILLKLLENFEFTVTVKYISEELNVSSRTITRELICIERFLNNYNIRLLRKSGVGVSLIGDMDNIRRVKELLNTYSPLNKCQKNQRVLYIMERILISEVKSLYFQIRFNISYMTFMKDIEYIRGVLNKFDLKVKGKKGIGFYVHGRESKIREALSYVFYEKMRSENLFLLFRNALRDREECDLDILNHKYIEFINSILFDVFDLFNVSLTNKVYTSLMVHLSLTIYRINQGIHGDIQRSDFNNYRKSLEFNISKVILNKISDRFNIKVCDGDILYIAIHIAAYNIYSSNGPYGEELNFDRLDKIKLSGDIIARVQEILGISFMDNASLIKNLSIHLGSAINRLVMRLNIRNPFLDMMKRDYKDIFEATKKACFILEEIVDSPIPDSEIGYITMHIATAYESKIQSEFKYRVLLYTEGERAMGLLLYNKILKEFPSIIIVKSVCSFESLSTFLNDNIDFIISTRDISNEYNYIKIGEDFTFQDILTIQDKIKEIYKIKVSLLNRCNTKYRYIDIDSINYLGDIIKLIEQEFVINSMSVDGDVRDVIREFVFNTLKYNHEEIYEEILRKEMLSSSYVKDLKILLLHTISRFSDKLYIGSYILDKEISIYQGRLNIIFYFIIPERMNNKVLRSIIGELTSNLVKDNIFIDLLRTNDIINIKSYVRKILSDYYVREIKETIRIFENTP